MSPAFLTGEMVNNIPAEGYAPQYEQYPWMWNTALCGIFMQHSLYTYEILNHILLGRGMRAIVEIGTGNGALSIILGLWGILLGVPVITLDIELPEEHALKMLEALGVHFHQADCFSEAITVPISSFTYPQYLLCDGGNKAKEVQTFSRLLEPGSLISAHDWGVEIFKEDVEGLPLEPFMPELWLRNNVQLATWRVT